MKTPTTKIVGNRSGKVDNPDQMRVEALRATRVLHIQTMIAARRRGDHKLQDWADQLDSCVRDQLVDLLGEWS